MLLYIVEAKKGCKKKSLNILSLAAYLLNTEGYKMERRDRDAHGGGIMTFIRADLPAKRRTDLESKDIECICVELNMNKRKWGILRLYRQPSL